MTDVTVTTPVTTPVTTRSVITRRGIEAKVHTRGSGPPMVWFHGAGGLLPVEPMLDQLGEHYTVHTPEWPGFGDEQNEVQLEDMLDFSNDAALTTFLVRNARRLGTAGKIMFPIPNRRLSKRLYRITNPTLLLWGSHDALVPPVYAERFQELLVSTTARLNIVEAAGHMLPYEQPAAAAAAVHAFLG